MKKLAVVFTLLICVVLPTMEAWGADRYSVATGNWNLTSTWSATSGGASGASAPVAADNAIIEGGFTVTLDAAKSATNVTVKTGSILNAATFALTVSGTFTLEGGGEFRQGGTITAVPGATRSFATTSTYTYNGTQAGMAGTPPTFGNLNFAPSPTGAGTFAVALVVAGNMTVNLGTVQEIRFATGTTGRIHSITGNLTIQGSSIVVGSNGSSTAGSVTITVGGNLNITAGTFRGTNDVGNATFNIAGNISNGGTWQQDDGSSTGTFAINLNGSSSSQDISGANAISFEDLTINNSNGVTLSRSIDQTGTLTLTNGQLTLGSSNLTIGSSGSISGASSSSYVITDGAGKLRRNVGSASPVLFPVGTTTNYNPVSIQTGTGSDDFSVRVLNGVSPTSANDSAALRKTWDISEATSGGNTPVTANFQWNGTDEASSFSRSSAACWRHNGTDAWVQEGNVTGISAVEPYVATVTDLMNFSNFTFGNPGELPIQLASFTGSVINGNNVLLDWTTISEVNNYGFFAQRRAEGETEFTEISNSFVPGHGTTLQPQHYLWTHSNVSPGQYEYRLRQVDLDGTVHFTYAVPVVVGAVLRVGEDIPSEFRLLQNYPNPFNPMTIVNYSVPPMFVSNGNGIMG